MNRLNFVKNFKAYTLRMKDRKKQNFALFRSYLKRQRSVIIQNTQRRMLKGVLWVGFLSVSYYIVHKIYSQKLQVQQMQSKLSRLYSSIVTKIQTEGKHQVFYVEPEYDDQLANIIQMCWKYHYKVIVSSDNPQKQFVNDFFKGYLHDVPQQVREKCLIINLKKLKNFQIDQINGTVKVQSGISCKILSQNLVKLGYEPIFPEEIQQNVNQTIFNAIINNYPTTNGSMSSNTINLDLISSQGQYFRSSNQNNEYGSTPNLNSIFIGTGGIFGLPSKAILKINRTNEQNKIIKRFQMTVNDMNQKLLTSRNLKQILSNYKYKQVNLKIFSTTPNKIQFSLKTTQANKDLLQLLKQRFQTQIPELKQVQLKQLQGKQKFNIFFNTNQVGFQKFLIYKQNKVQSVNHLNQGPTNDSNSSKGRILDYIYQKNLLKINCPDQTSTMQVISQLCSQNAVVVWCKDHKFYKNIKKMTDQSEVGSELMKIMVQIRQGIDRKKIYYNHNRYEEYFAKGMFRKLTEVFW